jgi:hypothetical protein
MGSLAFLTIRGRVALWAAVAASALVVDGCANRGMQAPFEEDGTGGIPGDGGKAGSGHGTGGGTGGIPATGTGGATGGRVGTGGSGTGGGAGAVATGGAAGGGAAGHATGGAAGGAAGMTGTGGTTGTGGMAGSGGAGAGGHAGGAGGQGGAAGAKPGTGGAAGTGGAGGGGGGRGGAGGATCPAGGVLDCSSTGALKLAGGQITDFSAAQWSPATSQWCDAGGLRGHLFSFAGTSSTATATVDTTAQNLKLSLMVGKTDYAGGGIMFESCVNASQFTSLQFTATVTTGSLTGCVWQVQLQTQDQRPTTATDPAGGTCTTNCERYPVVSSLAAPSATAAPYTETFTLFTNQTGSTIPMAGQITGVQWQVNSGSNGSGTCTVELRIDDVTFK